MFDYLVVGAGFAGGVLAERLAAGTGQEGPARRQADRISAATPTITTTRHGVLVHKYGPHIFHTNSREVFAYLSRFTEWRPYQHRVRAWVDGQLLPIPINLDTINRAVRPEPHLVRAATSSSSRSPSQEAQMQTSEDVIVSKVGRELYEKFFRNYTRKQWGLDPVGARRRGHRAGAGAHQPRRSLLHRHLSGDAAARLHAHVRADARAPEHQDYAQHRLSRDRGGDSATTR